MQDEAIVSRSEFLQTLVLDTYKPKALDTRTDEHINETTQQKTNQ